MNLSNKELVRIFLYVLMLIAVGIGIGSDMPNQYLAIWGHTESSWTLELSRYIGGVGAVCALGGGASLGGLCLRHVLLTWTKNRKSDVCRYEIVTAAITFVVGAGLSIIYWWPFVIGY